MNYVLIHREFRGVRELQKYCRALFNHADFRKDEPHVFLFSETPFKQTRYSEGKLAHRYRPPAERVQAWIHKIQEDLKLLHPLSFVAFSTYQREHQPDKPLDETGIPMRAVTYSNQSYLISANGATTYAKRILTDMDEPNLKSFTRGSEPRFQHAQNQWSARSQTQPPDAYSLTQTVSGVTLEHRVCADAQKQETGNALPIVTLVSAHKLGSALWTSPSLIDRRALLFVNDGINGRSLHRPGEPDHYAIRLDNELSPQNRRELTALLTKNAARIHLVN